MTIAERVKARTKDERPIIDPTSMQADVVLPALRRYSVDRPRERVAALDGNGAAFVFPVPADWVPGFSAIKDIEHPRGSNPPRLVDREDWAFYRAADGTAQIRFLYPPERGTGNVAVRYTTTITREQDVPAGDLDAVTDLATSLACEILANWWSNVTSKAAQPGGNASEAAQWAKRAIRYRELYEGALGIGGDDGQRAAGAHGGTNTPSFVGATGTWHSAAADMLLDEPMTHPRWWYR